MVEEIVLKGEDFDEQKKKWLKKYSEAEGLNYAELEGNLNDFFELLEDYKKSQSNALKRVLSNQASVCFINNNLLDKLISQQPQIILPPEKKLIIPGTQFKTVKIGNQIWMVENLNVDRFRNGDPIPEAKTDVDWLKAGKNKQSAWCYYDNNPSNGVKYGKLYNWYAVNDPRGLAPQGWHIPGDDEWTKLTDILGGEEVSGNKLKSFNGWKENGNGSDNFGFTALPGGYSDNNGTCLGIGYFGHWWSATERYAMYAWL